MITTLEHIFEVVRKNKYHTLYIYCEGIGKQNDIHRSMIIKPFVDNDYRGFEICADWSNLYTNERDEMMFYVQDVQSVLYNVTYTLEHMNVIKMSVEYV